MRSFGAGVAFQSYSELWQGSRPPNSPTDRSLDVGYLWGVGTTLGETFPWGPGLCPEKVSVVSWLQPSFPATGDSCGAPSRRSWKGRSVGGASGFQGQGRGEKRRREEGRVGEERSEKGRGWEGMRGDGKEWGEQRGQGGEDSRGRKGGGRVEGLCLTFSFYFSSFLLFPSQLFFLLPPSFYRFLPSFLLSILPVLLRSTIMLLEREGGAGGWSYPSSRHKPLPCGRGHVGLLSVSSCALMTPT